ncbi:hypothetical protein THAOC_35536, partial [Thalassiosira oceanica]
PKSLGSQISTLAQPHRQPTDFGPRSLPNASAPKHQSRGSEDMATIVRNPVVVTLCRPASTWMDPFNDNIFRTLGRSLAAGST